MVNTTKKTEIGTSNVVIMLMLECLNGGATLDTAGFVAESIGEGHVIIEETATGVLKPMPVAGESYGTLTAGHTFKGVLVADVATAKPFASIMVRGTANDVAAKFPYTTAIRTALPLIRFAHD